MLAWIPVAADAARMRRIFIWICISVAAAGLLGFVGLVAAIRVVPVATISHLPLITTVWLRNMTTDAGREVIRERLREEESAPLVVSYLSGSPGSQWQMLDAISEKTPHGASWSRKEEVNDLLRALCSHAEARVRLAARSNFNDVWQGVMWSKQWIGHQDKSFAGGQLPPGPGAWIPDRSVANTLILLTYLNAGYDHRMPSPYKMTIGYLIDFLLTKQDERGCFAADDRDHAIVTSALAEAYDLSNDTLLKNPVLKAQAWILRNSGGGTDARWSANTDLAVWDLTALESAAIGGLPNHIELVQKWMAQSPDFGKRCRENGHVLGAAPADILAQWGAMQALTGNITALEGIAEESLLPRPELSDVTNYWLALALFRRSAGANFSARIDPYLRHLYNDQQWDSSELKWGCFHPQGDPAGHALRLMIMGLSYYRPVSPLPVSNKP